MLRRGLSDPIPSGKGAVLSKIRPRLTYANVAATLALVFSMSGGALAATHYLISSKKQISPKVLKELKGNAGAKGATGPAGPQGGSGAAGPAGAPGSAIAYAVVAINSAGNPAFVSTPVGFTSVTKTNGVYCLTPSFAGNPVLVTPAGDTGPFAMGPSESCPGGYQIETTETLSTGQGFVAAVP
jgi:hypothetical protein